jgi:outer membrane immunogenic protein
MKKILLVAAAVTFSTAALATDMPYRAPAAQQVYSPAPAATWTGCYAGIVGGYDHMNVTGTKFDGGNIGGTLGCNVQTGNWVYGIEGDALWNSVSDTEPGLFKFKQDFLGSARGRLGVASSNALLLYATGGLGVGHLTLNGLGANAGINFDDTHVGWVAGAGIEWVVGANWTAKVEYLHYDFRVDGGALGSANYDADSVKVGLNYKFGN